MRRGRHPRRSSIPGTAEPAPRAVFVCLQARSGLCLHSMQRHASYRIAALGLLWLAGGAAAQTITTYRWVDAQGVVHYSDTPQPGAQVIQLQSAQTYRAPAPSAAAIKAARAEGASGNDPRRPISPATSASRPPRPRISLPRRSRSRWRCRRDCAEETR